ncbi:MAG: hypothetical protein ACRD4T_11830, partial [Candidatus Acidiferrales bacterium]
MNLAVTVPGFRVRGRLPYNGAGEPSRSAVGEPSDMFIGIKQLEQGRLFFDEKFPPGTIDFRTRDFRQAAVLEAEGSADLVGVEIHLEGRLRTQLEMNCS